MARTIAATAEVAEALHAVLPAMNDRTLDGLVRTAALAVVRRRDQILGEESSPRLTLMLDGWAGTWRTELDGRTRLVGLAGPGELAGLRALSPARAPIELVALTPGRAASWEPDTVLGFARSDAGLATDLLELSLLAADGLMARLDHTGSGSAYERVIAVLWHRRELAFDPGRPLLTRANVAELAGATRDMTDRVVRELEEDHVIERVGRTGLVLHDAVTLRRLAEQADDPI